VRHLFRRAGFIALGAAAFVILLPVVFLALDAIEIAVGAADDKAVANIGKSGEQVVIVRRPIWHPLLTNEFRRTLITLKDEKELLRSQMDADTGGYSMIHAYRLVDGDILLTDGIFCSRIGLRVGRISEVGAVITPIKFIGAFDDSGTERKFRFIPASEHALKPFEYVHPACLSQAS
jgi:hypothetical protein